MNAAEAKKYADQCRPEAEEREREWQLKLAKYKREEEEKKARERQEKFDKRLQRIERDIKNACKNGKTNCKLKVEYEDKEFQQEILNKLSEEGYKANIGGDSYYENNTNSEGFPTGDQYLVTYDVFVINWE